ncbi:DUF397 domain-containing protein [Nonomuraea typhae]|uniref:DUF397 domain-containing protein n=1 Tax=Nonomuraea typhae TaxID=2603600 RepID=UPI0012F77B28|nr:DUF397 domain-containing protein [Nonomuraea typhae]
MAGTQGQQTWPTPFLPGVWKVSSRCNGGNCVAVATEHNGRIAVRDTKTGAGPILSFSAAEWDAFITSIKDM